MEENKYYTPEIEIWKDVLGYEGYYQVSNMGQVKSINRVTNHNRKRKETILKLVISTGYRYVDLCKNGERVKYGVHRLVALAFIPNPENKPEVNHKDCNRSNNALSNLEWVTRSENSIHASQNGLLNDQWGENNPTAKLSEAEVKTIKQMIKTGKTVYSIHRDYFPSLHLQTLYAIKSNRRWKKVKI